MLLYKDCRLILLNALNYLVYKIISKKYIKPSNKYNNLIVCKLLITHINLK